MRLKKIAYIAWPLIAVAVAIPTVALASPSVGSTSANNHPYVLESGTYTPTYSSTNSQDVTSETFYTAKWSRVGDVVTVSGDLTLTPSATGGTYTQVEFSLPSDVPYTASGGTYDDVVGIMMGNAYVSPYEITGRVLLDTTTKNAILAFYSDNASPNYYNYTFQYVVK